MTAHSDSPRHAFDTKNHRPARIVLLVLLAIYSSSMDVRAAEDGNSHAALEERILAGPAVADLMQLALSANPAIAAAWQGWRAAVEEYRVKSGYPDPRLSVSYPTETRIGDEEWQISLSQTIPLSGRLTAQGDAATADIRIAQITYEKTVRDRMAQIRQSAHELIYLQEAVKIAAGNRELLDQLLAAGSAAYARDRTSLIDLSRAAAQSGQLQYDARLLEELAVTEKARLNGLLNREPGASIGPLAPPAFSPINHSLGELYRFAEENGSAVLLARTALTKAEQEVTLTRYQILPELDIGLFVNNIKEADPLNDNGRTGVKAVGATVSLSMPIWIDKNKGRMAASRARVEQAKAEVAERINEARAEASRLFFRLGNAERLIVLYRDELIPQAAKSVETAEIWFREGKGSLSDFTETRTVWYNFQLALARAQADHGQNLAALEGLTGRTLTDAGPPPTAVATPKKEVP